MRLPTSLAKVEELGASIAVDIDGELVVEIWGGHADRAGTVPWWGGWGGSMIVMNPDYRTTFAYVMTKMGPGNTGTERTNRYAGLIYDALS
jgi:hypothetical protein